MSFASVAEAEDAVEEGDVNDAELAQFVRTAAPGTFAASSLLEVVLESPHPSRLRQTLSALAARRDVRISPTRTSCPLILAVENPEALESFLTAFHDRLDECLNAVDFDEYAKGTVLHFVVNNEGRTQLQMLLDAGANPNIQNAYGETPLYLAVASDDPEMPAFI